MSELPARDTTDGLSRRDHFGWQELQAAVIHDGQELFCLIPDLQHHTCDSRELLDQLTTDEVQFRVFTNCLTIRTIACKLAGIRTQEFTVHVKCVPVLPLCNPVTGQSGFNVIGKQALVPTGGV